jgi:hypothetical protein
VKLFVFENKKRSFETKEKKISNIQTNSSVYHSALLEISLVFLKMGKQNLMNEKTKHFFQHSQTSIGHKHKKLSHADFQNAHCQNVRIFFALLRDFSTWIGPCHR